MATSGKPTLRELQDAFQKAVIDGDAAILDAIPANSRTSNDVLFGVYRHAYVARLVQVVGSDYERLAAYMGDEAFAGMARDYVGANPSNTPNARWFSHRLPEYLASTEPYSTKRELAEIAALERALADAFDAADAEAVTIEALRSMPPELWAELTFALHPSARRLDHSTDAHALWQALNAGEELPQVENSGGVIRLIVWRQDSTAKVRVLGAEEAMLLDEVGKGAAFGALCELAAYFDDSGTAALRAAQALQGWLSAGLIASAALASCTTGAEPAAAVKRGHRFAPVRPRSSAG